jgi:hypothetical protein
VNERTPDFDELVGSDLDPSERDRLQRIHELLLAAGPPPDFPGGLGEAPAQRVRALPRRARGALLALSAALGVLVFAVGFLVGDRAGEPGTFDVIVMTGAGATPDARASLEIFADDDAGNWPMELRVTGLPPTPSGRPYELWLTRDGATAALCGSFLAEPDGSTVVPMNAPYKLNEFDGWIVVEEGSTAAFLTT